MDRKAFSKLLLAIFLSLMSFNILQATTTDMYVSDSEGGVKKDTIDLDTTPTPWLYYQIPYAGKTLSTFLWTSSSDNYY
ncbi:hypothetical protein HZA55_01510 [Candidatus Poribacteria bacterium]|nr:hypothetical protein [Candidatus Poribacteria bacterium]